MTFNPDTTHPEYDAWLPSWQAARDAFDGADSIKGDRRENYLPRPSGFVIPVVKDGKADFVPDKAAYDRYIMRAEYPELVGLTVRGMLGLLHGRQSTYELPTSVEKGWKEKITRDGLALDAFHRRISREVMIAGRFGILADVPSQGADRPYLAGYVAEAIEDWDLDDDQSLIYLKLDESRNERDENGKWQEVQRKRELAIEDGRYVVRIWRKAASGWDMEGDEIFPTRRGGGFLDFIPFAFVGTNDLTPDPDEVPLLALANVATAIFRLDADWRHQLHLTGNEMLVYSGMSPDEVPPYIGAGIAICLAENAKADIIGPKGTGIQAHERAIAKEFERAIQAGAHLLADQSGGNESGEARKMRFAHESATVTTIARNIGAGLEKALRFALEFVGFEPTQAKVEPNTKFFDSTLSPEQINALIAGWTARAYSYDTLYQRLQEAEVTLPDRTAEQERKLITNEDFADLGVDETDDEDDNPEGEGEGE